MALYFVLRSMLEGSELDVSQERQHERLSVPCNGQPPTAPGLFGPAFAADRGSALAHVQPGVQLPKQLFYATRQRDQFLVLGWLQPAGPLRLTYIGRALPD